MSKIKVVHIIGGGDVGGAKTHVLYLLKELGRYIDVKLICLRPGSFADDAGKLGIDVSVVKSMSLLSDIKKVTDIIREGGYNIVHSHGAKANMFSLLSTQSTHIPTVTTIHSDYKLDYMHSMSKKYSIGLMNTIALRYIGNYIAVSRNFKNMLEKRNFSPSDIYVLYNGMDFSPTADYSRRNLLEKYRLGIDESDVIVGIAARLYPVKSLDTLVKAASLVKARNPHIKFLIGGDGEDRKQLEALSDSLGLSGTVHFLGWLDNPNELMSSVDISVLTSISESFAYSVLEGARFKKATISSNVGGIPDLITHGENGYLFEPGDHARLSELILELASDEKKRSEMGEKLYEKASSEFSVQHMARTQLDIYKGILEKNNRQKSGQKQYDAVISGYYGFQNIGDDAMLTSIINDLRKFKPDINIMILSRNPDETLKDYGVASISRMDLFGIYRAMKNARAFLYGGGNIIQDNTSTRSLFFYLSMVLLAKRLNLKVMFYANGIGPLRKSINRWMSGKILNRADVITLREQLSYNELKNMGIVRPKIRLTADPALTVIGDGGHGGTGIFKALGLECDGPFAGISLRKCPGHENLEHEPYESVIAALADHISERYGLFPVFIPMQYPVDIPILENVAQKMKNRCFVIKEKLDFLQTYEVISSMEILVGMRLHALIFSASAGVPMVGLDYDPKIQGFLEYVDQASAGDVKKLDLDLLKATFDDVWSRKQAIREQLVKDVAVLKEKARENARLAVELIDCGCLVNISNNEMEGA